MILLKADRVSDDLDPGSISHLLCIISLTLSPQICLEVSKQTSLHILAAAAFAEDVLSGLDIEMHLARSVCRMLLLAPCCSSLDSMGQV